MHIVHLCQRILYMETGWEPVLNARIQPQQAMAEVRNRLAGFIA